MSVKRITAIVPLDMLQALASSLRECGVPGVTVERVQGYRQQANYFRHDLMNENARRDLRRRGIRNPSVSKENPMLNLKVVCWSLGCWAAISFVVCVVWGLVMPQALHMHVFLEQVLPAFRWLTGWGFLLGLVESFLYGVYAGLVYVPLYNFFARRWGRDSR